MNSFSRPFLGSCSTYYWSAKGWCGKSFDVSLLYSEQYSHSTGIPSRAQDHTGTASFAIISKVRLVENQFGPHSVSVVFQAPPYSWTFWEVNSFGANVATSLKKLRTCKRRNSWFPSDTLAIPICSKSSPGLQIEAFPLSFPLSFLGLRWFPVSSLFLSCYFPLFLFRSSFPLFVSSSFLLAFLFFSFRPSLVFCRCIFLFYH